VEQTGTSAGLNYPSGLASMPRLVNESLMTANSIHIEKSARLPAFLLLGTDALLNGWAAVHNARSGLEEETRKAGWIFFFLAGKIETTAVGFNAAKTLRTALNRLTALVKSRNCNSFEIIGVTSSRFLGMSRVIVSAHARNLQKGAVCLGLES